MEELKKEINDLKKRVAELEKQVQPVDIEKIINIISQHLENELVSIADDTQLYT